MLEFTLKEWNTIRHCLECAQRDFKKSMIEAKPSNEEYSFYQIMAKQIGEAESILKKIENTPI